MSKRGPTQPREWQTMVPCRAIRSAELLAAHAKAGLEVHPDPEMWKNDRYVVIVRRIAVNEAGAPIPDQPLVEGGGAGPVAHLSIRRADRKAARDWRDFQRIKNDIAGRDAEAVELYPAEERVVDTANQFHLWCTIPGDRFNIGWQADIRNDDASRLPGAKQRAGSNDSKEE